MISKRRISRKVDFRRNSERKVQEKVTIQEVHRGIKRDFREESAEGVQRGVRVQKDQ